MQRITATVEPDHIDRLDTRVNDGEADSRSEAVRQVFDEYAELREECEQLRTECERLRREKRQVLDQRRESTELVEYVKQERERRRRREQANLATRAKWFLFGRDD